jgi:hypothetical protein
LFFAGGTCNRGRRSRGLDRNDLNSSRDRWWKYPYRRSRGLRFLGTFFNRRSRFSFRSSFSTSSPGTTPFPFVLFGFFLPYARLRFFHRRFFFTCQALLWAYTLASGNYTQAEVLRSVSGQRIQNFIRDLAGLFFS